MDTSPMDRDQQVVSVFASTLPALDRLFSTLELSEEQREELKGDLFSWFRRLSLRPPNEVIPVKQLQAGLVRGAWQLASDLWKLKSNGIPIFPRDPKEIAGELGLTLDDPEKEPPL